VRAVVALALLGGCSSARFDAYEAAPSDVGFAPGDADFSREVSLSVNVLPSQLRTSNELDAPYRVMPQTFPQEPIPETASLAIDLRLTAPVLQEGLLEGYRVNPSVADIPGQTVPITGLVVLQKPGTVQSYVTASAEDGTFSTWVVPDGGYRLEIVPEDPLLPFESALFDVLDPPQTASIDLEAGVPIYGRVTENGQPLIGARVRAVDEYGVSSAVALTDEYGLYQVRVTPGTWTVVSDGRDNGRDPTLKFSGNDVGEAGLALDIAYPRLVNADIEGAVDDADGKAADGATIRLVAETLTGFDGLDAAWSTEIAVNNEGFFYSAVVPGTYTVEVLPPVEGDGAALTPTRLDEVVVDAGDNSLPTIQLTPLVPLSGTVVGPNGAGLDSAHVLCDEIGFDGRTFEVFTGARGQFELEVPNVQLRCNVLPPAGRDNLSSSRFPVEPSSGPITLDLGPGQTVSGLVSLDGAPEGYAVVEIRDASNRLLGSGLTLEDGRFEVRVDLTSAY
jgi:hypothetical protein